MDVCNFQVGNLVRHRIFPEFGIVVRVVRVRGSLLLPPGDFEDAGVEDGQDIRLLVQWLSPQDGMSASEESPEDVARCSDV